MQQDIEFIEDPGGMKALFREANERVSAQLQGEFYVALNLEQMPINDARELMAEHPDGNMPDVTVFEGTAYYHLTLEHFAWLHSRMRQAKSAHRAGRLSEAAWATARMLWNEILEKARRAYDRGTLEAAVKSFKPGRYSLPEAPVQAPKGMRSTIPASCPYSQAYLEQAARERPHLVPCPASKSPWGWIEKHWCESKCRKVHPECIRHLYWIEPALPQGGLQ